MIMKRSASPRRNAALPSFVICINNTDYPASLERQKVYRVLPDAQAKRLKLVRVIDESGEDYLYPSDHFLPIRLSQRVLNALGLAA
jgi:hypothetical protein